MKGGSHIQDDLQVIPAGNLPDGWNWRLYDDGSGGLYSPEKKCVLDVDFATSEYRHKGVWHYISGYPYETVSRNEFMDSIEKYIRSEFVKVDNYSKSQPAEIDGTFPPSNKKESIFAAMEKNRELIKIEDNKQKGQAMKEPENLHKSYEAR